MKYATAICPERMNATGRVNNQANTNLFGNALEAPIGTRPAMPARRPPYNRTFPCYKNPIPNINGIRKATVDLMFVPDMVVNTGQSRGSPGIGWKLGTHRFSPCDCLLERLLGVLRSAGVFLHEGIIPVMFNQESPSPRQSRSLSDQLLEVR